MEMNIYVLGNIDFTYRILTALNMLYQGQAMHLMAGVILILFLFWSFIKWMLNPEKSPYPFREFAFGIIFYMIFGGLPNISPRVDVLLETDPYGSATYQTRTVADIPILAVAPAWIMTNLFRGLRDTMAPLLYIPGEMAGAGYPGIGSGIDPLAILIDANDMSMGITPSLRFPYVEKSIKHYMKDCYIPFHSFDGTSTDEDYSPLLNSPVDEIWSKASVSVNWLSTKHFTNAEPSGAGKSCAEAYTLIETSLNGEMKPAITNYLSSLDISAVDMQNSMALVLNSFTGATVPNPYDFMVGKFASTYIAQVFVESPTTMMSNKMMFEASQRRVFERAAESNLFVQVMVPIITAIESFAFFIAPILLLFTVMGGSGMSYLGKYLMLTLFINLWGFIKIFTDFFMLLAVHLNFEGDLSVDTHMNPFTFENQYATYMELENFLSIASSLTLAIPMFAMFLLYGGVHSLMGVMRTMTAANADAANVAPNIATSYSGGGLTMADTRAQASISTSAFAQTHTPGSSAQYVDENITKQTSFTTQQLLSKAQAKLETASSSLNNNLSNLFQSGNTGAETITSSSREGTTLSAGIQQANQIAEGMGVSADVGNREDAMNVGRVAASFALQLRGEGMTSKKFGDLTPAEQDEMGNKFAKGFGFGADANLSSITQYTEGGSEAFSQRVEDSLKYIESTTTGQQYSEGFDFSTADRNDTTGTISQSVSEIRGNLQNIQASQNNISSLQNTVSDNEAFSVNKLVRWNQAAAGLAEKGGGNQSEMFRLGFEKMDSDTQSSILKRYSGQSSDDVFARLSSETGGDAIRSFQAITDDFKRINDFDAAAGVYEGVGSFAGVYQYGFDSAGESLRNIDDLKDNIDANQLTDRSGIVSDVNGIPTGSPTNLNLNTGKVAGSESVETKASEAVAKPIGNAAVVNSRDENNIPSLTPQTANFDNKVSVDTASMEKTFDGMQNKFATKEDILENADPLRAVSGISGGIISAVDSVFDYVAGPDQKWGKDGDAQQIGQITGSIAAAEGYSSSTLGENMQKLLQYDNKDFRDLSQRAEQGSLSAYHELSELNDAALFITNTGQDGRDVFKALNDDDQDRLAYNIGNTFQMIGKLEDGNGPISTDEMNEISRARLEGSITDSQASELVRMAVQGESYSGGGLTSEKSTMYSAANGSIADNDTLRNIVSRTGNDAAVEQLVETPPIQPIQSGESNSNGILDSQSESSSSANYSPASNRTETQSEYAKAYAKDVVADNIRDVYRGDILEVDGNIVQGINKELPDLDSLQGMASQYANRILAPDLSDDPTARLMQSSVLSGPSSNNDNKYVADIPAFNDQVIDSQTVSSYFNMGTADKEGFVYSSIVIDPSRITEGLEGMPEAARLESALTDLGNKAEFFGYGIHRMDLETAAEQFPKNSDFAINPNRGKGPAIE